MTETTTEVEAPPQEPAHEYPYLRVQVYTHTDDGFTPRIGFDLDKAWTDVQALTFIGKELNRGDTSVGPRYRSAGFPPLGAGDLIRLGKTDERWWLCDATGWKQVDRPETVPAEYVQGERTKRVRRG